MVLGSFCEDDVKKNRNFYIGINSRELSHTVTKLFDGDQSRCTFWSEDSKQIVLKKEDEKKGEAGKDGKGEDKEKHGDKGKEKGTGNEGEEVGDQIEGDPDGEEQKESGSQDTGKDDNQENGSSGNQEENQDQGKQDDGTDQSGGDQEKKDEN